MTKKHSLIVLDLDGVLIDFCGAVLRLHEKNPDTAWPEGDRSALWRLCGVSKKEMWANIDKAGTQFWSHMIHDYSWADRLYEALRALDVPMIIATSPALSSISSAGKHAWLRSWDTSWQNGWGQWLIGPAKWALARPGAILIDDRDANCQKFEHHEGQAIVFPQPWNSRFPCCDDDRVEYTLKMIREKAALL